MACSSQPSANVLCVPRDMQGPCCKLLIAILDKTYLSTASLEPLLPFMQPNLSSAIESFETSTGPDPAMGEPALQLLSPAGEQSAGRTAVAELIDKLTVQACSLPPLCSAAHVT